MWKRIMIGSAGVLLMAVGVAGCSSNPYKAKNVDTTLDKAQKVTGDEQVGVKDGNLVVQKKVALNEELRRLQYTVYKLEDHVYGNKDYGSKGLYGALKDCRSELASKKYGGDGKMTWTEPADRVTDKEDQWNVGIDEKDKLVAVSEEFLKDRMDRFKGYLQLLKKRQGEYEEKLEICDNDLKAKKQSMSATTDGDKGDN